MLETVVLLNIFLKVWYFFRINWWIISKKERNLFYWPQALEQQSILLQKISILN